MTSLRMRRWQPSPLIWLTVVLHVLLLAAWLAFPDAWRWWLAGLVGNHLLLTLVGLWPRSTWLGPNWTQLPAASAHRGDIALTIDDGPDPVVTPQVLDLLDQHGVKATFFCIGEKALQHQALCKDIVARGHAIENHSQQHRHYFSVLGWGRLRREILHAQDSLTAITGRRPQFFRAPAGLRNPFLDPVLHGLGLQLAAWSCRGFDTRTQDPATVLARLLPGVRAGAILLLHDGNCARTPAGKPVVLDVLPVIFATAAAAGLRFITLAEADAAHPCKSEVINVPFHASS